MLILKKGYCILTNKKLNPSCEEPAVALCTVLCDAVLCDAGAWCCSIVLGLS
jgi:hypothetical protein